MTRDGIEGTHVVEAALRAASPDGLAAEVRAAHVSQIRARARELGPAGAPATRHRPRLDGWARMAAVVAAFAVVSLLGIGGVAWAARDALPGEPLYGLKTAGERALGLLHRTPTSATDHLLERAERRLEEADRLAADGHDARLLAETLEAHDALLAEAAARASGHPRLEARVQGRAATAVPRLEALLGGGLPPTAAQQARDSLQAVIDRLDGSAEERPPVGPSAGPPRDTPPVGVPGGAGTGGQAPAGAPGGGAPVTPPAAGRPEVPDASTPERAPTPSPTPAPPPPDDSTPDAVDEAPPAGNGGPPRATPPGKPDPPSQRSERAPRQPGRPDQGSDRQSGSAPAGDASGQQSTSQDDASQQSLATPEADEPVAP